MKVLVRGSRLVASVMLMTLLAVAALIDFPVWAAASQAASGTSAAMASGGAAAVRSVVVQVRVHPFAVVEDAFWNPDTGPMVVVKPAPAPTSLDPGAPPGVRGQGFTWLSLVIDRNCPILLRTGIRQPFTAVSDTRVRLPTGVEIWYGNQLPEQPAGAAVTWTPEAGGRQEQDLVSAPVWQPGPGVSGSSRIFLVAWASFGPHPDQAAAGTYVAEFSLVIEQADGGV